MSKPRGYYFDRAMDAVPGRGPWSDWLICTAIVAILAGLAGWMLSSLLIIWLFVPEFDGNHGFGWVYLASVLAWVVPGSAWSAYLVHRDRHTVAYGRRWSDDYWQATAPPPPGGDSSSAGIGSTRTEDAKP